jgi:hypothetical protein
MAGFEVVTEVGDLETLLSAVADVRMPPDFTDEGVRASLAIKRQWLRTAPRWTRRWPPSYWCVATAIRWTGSPRESAVAKHINSIFTKLDPPEADADHRRVLAVLRFLGVASVRSA